MISMNFFLFCTAKKFMFAFLIFLFCSQFALISGCNEESKKNNIDINDFECWYQGVQERSDRKYNAVQDVLSNAEGQGGNAALVAGIVAVGGLATDVDNFYCKSKYSNVNSVTPVVFYDGLVKKYCSKEDVISIPSDNTATVTVVTVKSNVDYLGFLYEENKRMKIYQVRKDGLTEIDTNTSFSYLVGKYNCENLLSK